MKIQTYPISILQDTPLQKKKARIRYLDTKTKSMGAEFRRFGLDPIKYMMLLHELSVLKNQTMEAEQ